MNIELTGNDRELQQALARLGQFGRRDAYYFLREAASHMRSVVQLRFDRQTGPGGMRWWPSARASKQGGQTLRASSLLRNSITAHATATEGRVGTNVVYAARHQFGFRGAVQVPAHVRIVAKAFGRTLPFPVAATVKAHTAYAFTPRRPFLGFDNQDRADLLEIAREHLQRVAGAAAGAAV